LTRYLDFSANYASLLSTGTYGSGSFTDIGGFSRAHIGIFQTGMQGATPIVVGYDSSHGTYTSFGSSILKDPQNMAIVLAPEPSSLASCLLGLGALSWFVRKRK
jgi:hypothetical protein